MNIKKILLFAVGPIGTAILGFISLPIITWYFPQEDIGKISLLPVVISLSTLVFSLGLDQSYVREYHESDNKYLLFKESFYPGFILLIIFFTFTIFFDDKILAKFVFDENSHYYSYLLIISILSSFSSRFLSLILRMDEKGGLYSLSQLIPKVVFLIFILGCFLFNVKNEFILLVVAYLISHVSILLLLLFFNRKYLYKTFNLKIKIHNIIEYLKFGLPLVLGGAAYWGLTAIDKVFIRYYSSLDELGLYSVSVSFAGAAIILQSIFSTIWAPTVYKWAAENKNMDQIDRIRNYILLLILFIFCLTGLFSWVVKYILPLEYAKAQFIVISCLGFPLLYTLSETTVIGIGITKKSKYSMLVSIIAFGVNLLGNYFFIPIFGASGAAVSTCFSFYIFFILRTEFSVYLWRSFARSKMYFSITWVVILSIYCTLYATGDKYIYAWLMTSLGVIVLFKDDIFQLVMLVKDRIKSGDSSYN
ncbi:lipopolysaccharide biosynthesis protein [Photobacterium leiognathi]|uniref:lipopolysaccharide biosynthesis protein n=1 Tax=Photobacterium leiognathi TaxID=553611 RepID=UPI0029814507|nr:oligosaccharide flippase family protein [Photobacterium leiognathi]